ncbi:transposase (plasmid) [Lichenicola cladoniae]|uniref:Transposase n=1 Tax=Lichenicola cladoniae TaxID=1484109 RepID=A0A6M8HYN5_9PROT|nr:transposase [Lichenicola cladoniae]NPD67648.1 transposase [Acetobacteraceae bacterium]QKE93643.1 transposase [Lichenicola cladoniae]
MLDSTGLQVFGQGEWGAEKHGRIPRQWRRLHLAVDAQTGEIVAHRLTDKDTGDITKLAGHLATVEGQIASLIADGAYDSASVYDAAAARQFNPLPDIVVPPRASSIVNTDAHIQTIRDRHVHPVLKGQGIVPPTLSPRRQSKAPKRASLNAVSSTSLRDQWSPRGSGFSISACISHLTNTSRYR